MPSFVHAGIRFHYRETGSGTPFVFQHGLGGESNQTFDLYTPPPGTRLITLDCRAHGATQPVGDPAHLTFATLTDDVIALLDFLGLEQVVAGGISMGAGVALNLALRYAQRVRALILSRPAWLDQPLPPNLLVYPAIAWLLHTCGAAEGRQRFADSGAYAQMLSASPDAAASLLGQFDLPLAAERVARLERIPLDRPCGNLCACAAFTAPVLVLATHLDPIHSFDLAGRLAESFPHAQLAEVTPKSVDRERHRADAQAAIDGFLAACVLSWPPGCRAAPPA